jgi:SAM-dependent methyltransferase
MRVRDLIRFRDDLIIRLEQLEIGEAVNQSHGILIQALAQDYAIKSGTAYEKIHSALSTFKNLGESVKNTISTLKTAIDDINQDIDKLAAELLIKKDEYPHSHFYKKPTLFTQSEENIKFIWDRLRGYSNLRYPGMQLFCRAPYLTVEMVVNDPLYLCDHHMEYIDTTVEQFNEIYQRRLAKYVISADPERSLSQLPQNQFGFILSWMYFNYYELDTLTSFLKSILTTLRPGGVFMFSYNNGDLLPSCRISEYGGMSFIPKRNLIKTCIELGFEIIKTFDIPNVDDLSTPDDKVEYISWVEIKKPGVLQTAKRTQTLGEIISK